MHESNAYEKSLKIGRPKCASHKGDCSIKEEMRHDAKATKRQTRRKVRRFNKSLVFE